MQDKLVSSWFREVLDNSRVDEAFSLDGSEEGLESLFAEVKEDCDFVASLEGGYSIYSVREWDKPTVVLFSPEGVVAGYYHDFLCFILPEHRGRGFGVELIQSYASFFGEGAWLGSEDACVGIGFSAAGYQIHSDAREAAMEIAGLVEDCESEEDTTWSL